MTIGGALSELNNLLKADDIPVYYKPSIKAVMDTITLSSSEKPKMGRWIPIEYDGYADGYPVWDKWECSECVCEHNGDEESLTAFCPNCGAKM